MSNLHKKIKGKSPLKKLFSVLHLWLGIASACVLFSVCLTGTIFVFHTEIEKVLNPKKFTVKAGTAALSPDVLLAMVEKNTDGKVVSFQIPANTNETWLFNVKGKNGLSSEMKGEGERLTKREDKRGVPFYVNPYTGAITGSGATRAGIFFRNIEDLHRWFFLGKPAGKIITGSAGLIFLLLSISGVVIWLPKKLKHWRNGFKIKFSAKWKRVNFDLHRAIGIYILPIILLCALTGPAWSFQWYRAGISIVLGSEVLKPVKEQPLKLSAIAEAGKKMSYEKLLTISNTFYPGKKITTVNIPANSNDVVLISALHDGFLKMSGTDKIQLNPYTGAVLKTDLFNDKRMGEKLAASFRAIHVGEIFGTFSKIIYFILCLLATSLPVTGVVIWVNKFKKKARRTAAVPTPIKTGKPQDVLVTR